MQLDFGRSELAQARCEALDEALQALAQLVYTPDGANVDGDTGRILVPVPCGRNGFDAYGLTPLERDVLRYVLLQWQRDTRRPAWLRYAGRAWHVDLRHYPALGPALAYLQRYKVTPAQYEEARRQCRRRGGRVRRRKGDEDS